METQFDYPSLTEMVKLCRELQTDKARLEDEIRSLRLELEKSDAETAWAAAIFEGEGSLHCAKTGICMRVGMCDRDVVERWGRIVGVGKIRWDPPRGSGTKPQYSWAIHKIHDVRAVCLRFRPWMGARRLEQMHTAFEKYWAQRQPTAEPAAAPGEGEG